MSKAAGRPATKAGILGTVLIADDDSGALSSFSRLLQHCGVTTYEASTGEGAVASALAHRPDVVVLDNRLGSREDMTGIDVIDALHAQSFYPTWILYSGFMDVHLAADAGRRQVFSVIELPSTEIDTAVMEALIATRRGDAGGWPLLPVGPLTGVSETNAGRGAGWILAACDSADDLASFSAWASCVDASEGRMRDLYRQMKLDPHQVKSFMRWFRALTRACGHVENAVAELTVGDARTLKRLRDEGGLVHTVTIRIPLEQFLRTQTFVPADHALMTAMQSLIATRILRASFNR